MSRARRSRYAWGLALCISGAASAQTRPEPRPVAPPALCTLVRSNSLAFAAPAPAPNAQTQLQLASTATGAIVAFRARTSDELVVLRVDDSFVRVGEDRVVAGPVTAFSLAAAPGGAVLAAAERVARDGRDAHDDVLIARLDANGNARNIPRSLARTTRCDGVAVRPSATGFVVAWGSLDGPTTSTVTVDTRGVPTARARVVVDASAPMMVALTGETRFAMTVRGASGSSLLHLDESGASVEAFTLSAQAAVIAALPSNVLVFSAAADGVARWWPSSAVSEQPLLLSRTLGPSLQLVSAHNDRAALIVVDDRSGREHLVRVTSDGGSALLASIAGARGAVAPSLDGSSLVSVTHNSVGGLDLARWTCPRVNPPTNTTAPTVSIAGADAGPEADASSP
ncbi:MAG: hypothetical protein U0269_22290 [Polyangiales bacterium]